MKQIALIGCGNRGIVYLKEALRLPELQVTAVCDADAAKADRAAALVGPECRAFGSAEEFFAAGRLADALIIATSDFEHTVCALPALRAGYDLLLEKPVAPTWEECVEIARTAHMCKRTVLVCHVLRYAPFYQTLRRVLNSGAIGQIVNINHTEHVGFWHFAHSFVRGPWHNTRDSCPLILAKCCHDLDLLSWYIGRECTSVSSEGGRTVFCAENAPEGAGLRCYECAIEDACPYDVKKIYLRTRAGEQAPVLDGVAEMHLLNDVNGTREQLDQALRTGPYGRCVYHCDNNVCDHQTAQMIWDGGATATLTITPFSRDCYRSMEISGTYGEVIADDRSDVIVVRRFADDSLERVPVPGTDGPGHLGGDAGIIRTLADWMCGRDVPQDFMTTIDCTLRSHAIAFAAERSRLSGGAAVPVILPEL